MKKVSMPLLPDLHTGCTPRQLQLALFDRFRKEKKSLKRRVLLQTEPDVEHITALFVAQIFSQHPPSKKQVNSGIRSWIRVRWRLWITQLGKLFKS